jgi:hypothetical protein
METQDTSVFTLRIDGENLSPKTFPMERLAEYMTLVAKLVGIDNQPIFKEVSEGSACLEVAVPSSRETHTEQSLKRAANDPSYKNHKYIGHIEESLSKHGYKSAELFNARKELIFLVTPQDAKITHSVWQEGEIDGEITGVRGADDTMHIEIRDNTGLISNLVCKDLSLALDIAQKHLRRGTVRLLVEGKWNRTAKGWKADAKQCEVTGYQSLDETPLLELMLQIRALPNNGWNTLQDPLQAWKDLRGIDMGATV